MAQKKGRGYEMEKDAATASIILRFGAWGYDSRTWAASTRKQYQAVLYRAARQMGGIEVNETGQERVRIERLLEATPQEVSAWIAQQPRNADTRNHVLAVLDAFYQWLVAEGVRADNPTDGIRRMKRKRTQPRALGPKDADRLLRAVRAESDMRVQALIGLMIWAGLRVREARHARWTDISSEGWLSVTRETAKGGHEREVPLHEDLREVLDRWEPQCPSHEWIVPSTVRPERPASYSWAYQRVKEVGEHAGLEIHPHKLRGTFATGLLETGTDIRVIAEALGHASVQTTMRYTRTRPALVADAVRRLRYGTEEVA